jgi:hypothetical protein
VQLTLDLTTDSSDAAVEAAAVPELDRLSSQAAASLAEIIRAYRAAHRLARTGEPDLGDWSDDPPGVRGVHPHEHRRSTVA